MIYLMLGYLRIFTNLRQRQLYQISNSLKTENSLTVLPRLLSVFRTECRRSSAKNSQPSLQKCQKSSVNVSMLKAGHNTVSHHRLSLLFPKLRLSNFMISSLASAIFVQCPPPPEKKNVHTIEHCRQNLLLQ